MNAPEMPCWAGASAGRARALVVAMFVSLTRIATGGQEPDDLVPELLPPHPELVPTFWEQYGVWIAVGGPLVLGFIIWAIWRLLQPDPARAVPPEVRARESLDSLRRKPEDGIVLSRVSQVLRRYTAEVFELPLVERTTTEFRHALSASPKPGRELAESIVEFLGRCDERKFAPNAPVEELGAAVRALRLVEIAEQRRAQLRIEAAKDAGRVPQKS